MTGDAFLAGPAEPGYRAAQPGAAADGAGRPAPILDQPFDSGTLYALRAAVQAHACQAGMPEDRAGDVVLAIHELAANAIMHGAGRGRLRMWYLPGTLSCEILDAGPPASGDPGADGGADRGAPVADPWPAVDGHGLWLVHQVASRLEVRSGSRGTRALVSFALPPGIID
jgi:anti-sigma regulatory factor (Ser/Thr protein kinase)